LQTVTGASKLLAVSGLHPEELRDQVTSPKGTTQAALESLEKNNLRKIVQDAVEAAKARSIELSNA
jgi:pyrroline-5-carboxylate reductase